jgi:hypothetical protein
MALSVNCRLIALLVIVLLSVGCAGSGRVYGGSVGAKMPDEDVATFWVNLYVKSIVGDADKFEQPKNCIVSGFTAKLLPGQYRVTVGGNRHLITLLVDAEAGHRYEVQYDREYMWRFSKRGPYDLDHTWIEDTSTGRRVSDIYTEIANFGPRRRMKAYPPDNYSHCWEVPEGYDEDYFYTPD